MVVWRLTWKETLKWSPGTLPSFIPAFASSDRWMKIFWIDMMYEAAFICSPLLFIIQLPQRVFLSPPGVYDEDCQWTVQVNRLQKLIDRLEQKVASTFSSAFFFYIFLFCICLSSAIYPSGLYIILWNWLQIMINRFATTVVNSTCPHNEHLDICSYRRNKEKTKQCVVNWRCI